MRLAYDGVVAVAVHALLAGKLLQAVDAHKPLHENIHQFHEKTEFLHGNNQRVILLAEMTFHKLSGFPFDELSLGCIGSALRLRAFRSDSLKLHTAVRPQHRYGFFLSGPHYDCAGSLRCRIFERPLQDAMHDQVRIAPDGRCEMSVFLDCQSEVSQWIGGVTRLFQRPEHEERKDALFRLSGDFFGKPLIVLWENRDFLGRWQRYSHRAHSAAALASGACGGLHLSVLHNDLALRQVFDSQRITK